MANVLNVLSYASTNVTTSAYVQLIAATTKSVNEILVTDTSGSLMKLAVGGGPIAAVQAHLLNQSITYKAVVGGTAGNSITVTLADPGTPSSALSVGVIASDITVNLQSNAGVAATATLVLTANIILTSVATGAARNTNTFTTNVAAAAANPTDTILASFTGTSAAISCTITPNDGTNNGAVPVDLTTAELRELITTGAVAGKSVTITDVSTLRHLQTATGGDATVLVNGGEGDGVVGTFSGGVTYSLISTATQVVAALTGDVSASALITSSTSAGGTVLIALVQTNLAGGLAASSGGQVDLFEIPVNATVLIPLLTTDLIPIGSTIWIKAINTNATTGYNALTLL